MKLEQLLRLFLLYLQIEFLKKEKMIKKPYRLILFILLLHVSFAVLKAQDDNIIDKVIWVVGDEAILKSDVEEHRLGMLMNRQRMEGDPYCFIPEQLAVRKLYLDQAKADSIDIPAAELNRAVSRQENYYIQNVGGGSREKLEEYWGQTIHQIRERLYEDMRTQELVSEVQRSLTKNLTLTPSEVRKYYAQLPKDSLPFIETSVEVQILTNEPVVPLEEIDIVRGRLRDFTQRINSGEMDFATLAILYSEDGSAPNGGELGFMGRAMLDPAFANVAFALSNTKQVSNIVETEFGYHIIQLIERRGDRANFRHIILRPKVPEAQVDKSKKILSEIRDSVMSDVISFEHAVAYASYDKDTRNSEGLMVNTKTGYDGSPFSTSRFLMEELPPEIGKVVVDMKVGEISQPFVFKQERTGKNIVGIVKLKSRTDGHIANVSDDYEDLRVMVESKKREEILKKWVQRKIKDTYIYIDEDWKNCDFQYDGWIKEN